MITKGHGALGRIYERLRKRSYRQRDKDFWTVGPVVDARKLHEARVNAYREALKEVDRNLTGIYYEERLGNGKTLVSGR